ncbi:MAG: hypothetical protein KFH87_03170 [Bacteroidetes bacterium]|nr:hypothetical protein [Bacteroidota bacterium]
MKRSNTICRQGRHLSGINWGILLFFLTGAAINAQTQNEPLAEKIRSLLHHDVCTVNALVQTSMRFSLADDDFQGGRTFEAGNARLSVRGSLDGGFYYRLYFNVLHAPGILDAYVGYAYSDALQVSVGAMKPRQSLDYIPDPGSTDFIDRTTISALLVQSREIGVAFDGRYRGLFYFAGMFNGNKLLTNNNNAFYGIGRLGYALDHVLPGTLEFALQGSHGKSEGVTSGSTGPVINGERTIYGADVRWETSSTLLSAEYLEGKLETAESLGDMLTISGYYVTAGYRITEQSMVLLRMQTWNAGGGVTDDVQYTIGLNHAFTGIVSAQLNADVFEPATGERRSGISGLLQVQF